MLLKKDKLDQVFAQLVKCRNNYKCEGCGTKFDPSNLEGLDCSHYISRSYTIIRVNPYNAFAHCRDPYTGFGCHLRYSSNQELFDTHYDNVYDSDTRQLMRMLKWKVCTLEEYQKDLIYEDYKEQLTQMQERRMCGDQSYIPFTMLEFG